MGLLNFYLSFFGLTLIVTIHSIHQNTLSYKNIIVQKVREMYALLIGTEEKILPQLSKLNLCDCFWEWHSNIYIMDRFTN